MKLYNVNIDEGYVIPAKNHGSPRSSVRASSKSTFLSIYSLIYKSSQKIK